MWSSVERNRQIDALAKRWELRIHAIAIVVTATVLAMRLIAGTQDLTSEAARWQDEASSNGEEAGVAAPSPAP